MAKSTDDLPRDQDVSADQAPDVTTGPPPPSDDPDGNDTYGDSRDGLGNDPDFADGRGNDADLSDEDEDDEDDEDDFDADEYSERLRRARFVWRLRVLGQLGIFASIIGGLVWAGTRWLEKHAEVPPQPVRIEQLSVGKMAIYYPTPASRARLTRDTWIGFGQKGVVDTVEALELDVVERGQVLASLRMPPALARRLRQIEIGADGASTALTEKSTPAGVRRLQLVAPHSGIITESRLLVKTRVRKGQRLLRITDLSEVRLTFDRLPREKKKKSRWSIGDQVFISSDGAPPSPGRVTRVKSTRRGVKLEVLLVDEERRVGKFDRRDFRLVREFASEVFAITETAVLEHEDGSWYIIRAGAIGAEWVPVMVVDRWKGQVFFTAMDEQDKTDDAIQVAPAKAGDGVVSAHLGGRELDQIANGTPLSFVGNGN